MNILLVFHWVIPAPSALYVGTRDSFSSFLFLFARSLLTCPLPSLWQVEQEAIKREKDSRSKDRLAAVQKELANLDEQLRPLKARLNAERERTNQIREAKSKLDSLRAKAEAAERRQDYALAADLRYGAIPDVQKHILELEKKAAEAKNQGSLINEIVGPEQIAEVCITHIFYTLACLFSAVS